MMIAPSLTSAADTVDLPEPIPPVSPTTITLRTSACRRVVCSLAPGSDRRQSAHRGDDRFRLLLRKVVTGPGDDPLVDQRRELGDVAVRVTQRRRRTDAVVAAVEHDRWNVDRRLR